MRTGVTESLPVVLLGGGTAAVSVARSLGEAAVPVHAFGDREWDTVGRSRYCASFVNVSGDDLLQERYFELLSKRPVGEAVIFPCDDESLELLAHRRSALLELGYRPMEANDEALLAMLDKERTYRLAEAAGIGVPRRFVVEDAGDAERQLEAAGITFPCALKPLYSHQFARKFGASTKVFLAADRDQLTRLLTTVDQLGSKMMVTEIIPGPEDSYCSLYAYLDEDGEPLFQLTKRKLRQFPVGFGLGTYHITDWSEEVAREGLRFCQGVNLRGVACVEFKRDARDGLLKVIECNHRFTLAGELLRYAGINLPLLAYNRLLGRALPPMDGYRTGVRLWVPRGDVSAFRSGRARGELTTMDWIGSLLHRQHFPLFDPRDPGPWLAVHYGRARRLSQRAIWRSRRSR